MLLSVLVSVVVSLLIFITFVLYSILTLMIRATASVESLYDVVSKKTAEEIAQEFAKRGYKIVKDN